MKTSFFATRLRSVLSPILLLLFLCLAQTSRAQLTPGQWDEVVGKEIRNNQGVLVARVVDTAVDLERGRYVGMVATYGGFLGLGKKTVIIPPGALKDVDVANTLYLDMDKQRFHGAPTFELSRGVTPPQSAKVAAAYRYFGRTPYFAVKNERPAQPGQPVESLGFVQRTSDIISLPVENMQGRPLGYVFGLRELNRVTGRISGVVIRPFQHVSSESMKVVPPQALRYTRNYLGLRLNDHEQAFRDSSEFFMNATGAFEEENSARPGGHPAPLVHGEGNADREISMKITSRVSNDNQLSHYARNIEIKTLNGKVTLRGRVESDEDRSRLKEYAVEAAGEENVTILIQVQAITAAENAIDR